MSWYYFEQKLHSILPQILDYIIFPVCLPELVFVNENKKAREYSAVEDLVKEKEWWQAMDKTREFYSEYIRLGNGSVDTSILLSKALSRLDIENESNVVEAFRLARIVALMKERTCFAKQARDEGDVLPREMYILLRNRADYLVAKNSEYYTTKTSAERAMSEIILRWREFLDICMACDSGAMGEKYMRRSNVCIPRAVEKLEKLTRYSKRKAPPKIIYEDDDDDIMIGNECGEALFSDLPPTLLRIAYGLGGQKPLK